MRSKGERKTSLKKGGRLVASPLTPHSSPFLIIAHRGASGHAPENTLKAFDKAIELGARWIELDVQLHGSSLLVFHDLRLERRTNGRGRVSERSLRYLRGLDAGGGQRIPLLNEALDLVARRARINIELKTGRGTARAVAELLKRYLKRGWRPDDFLVSSFVLPELREFKRRLPQVPRGVLLCVVPLDLAACATELGADVVTLDQDF
ncbi:MAG: hypothetical protein HYZ32_03420, partial [Hydrocarboniphaga effusa]|nr:hypothetical protein [Hydrocarboniphaga effusa]